MSIRADDIKLLHRVVGTKHVFTSPDVPELHVSHADETEARNAVQSALDMLERMQERSAARETFQRRSRETGAA